MVLSHLIISCFLILWWYVTCECDGIFTVWYDDLDEIENGNWIVKGSVNPTHSNYCPTSNNCVQIESQSSIKTSITSKDYLNFTLLFGITISDDENNTFDNDYCRVYYKINKINANTSTQNWKLLASFLHDVTSDFNNKLPSQSYEFVSSLSNDYYESIDLQFINIANASKRQSCYIDEISLIAQFYHTPSKPFQPHINTLYLVIGIFTIILCAFLVCLLWFYFHLARVDKYRSQLQNIEALKMDPDADTAGKISISTARNTINTPISVVLAGSYHSQNGRVATTKTSDEPILLEQNDPSVNNFHKKTNKQTETDILNENKSDKNNVPAICTPKFTGPTVSGTNTQIKLNNIITEVLNKNDDNVSATTSVLSSRRDTELSTNTITAFQANINLTLYDAPVYEGKNINDELDFKNAPFTTITSFNTSTQTTPCIEENEHQSLSFAIDTSTTDIIYVSRLKNRYPNNYKSVNNENNNDMNINQNNSKKIKVTKYTADEEEESLDIGSIASNTVSRSPIPISRDNSIISQSSNIDQSQKL